MDDPLIGLTIFDSRQKPGLSGPGRPVLSTTAQNGQVDSNKLQEEKRQKRDRSADKEWKGDSSKPTSTKEKQKSSGTVQKASWKGHGGKKANFGGKTKPTRDPDINGDLDKCFPCLPGLEEPPEMEKHEASAPSSSESEATTPTSPPPLNETPLDSGTSMMAIDTTPLTPGVVDSNILMNSPVPQPQNYWLMRLFQSKLFDMSIAIGYLFNSKDSDVQAYLGNKLFVSQRSYKCLILFSLDMHMFKT